MLHIFIQSVVGVMFVEYVDIFHNFGPTFCWFIFERGNEVKM